MTKNKCLILKLIKMKNLENHGVQELNAMEITEVDGGLLLFPWKKAWDILSKAATALEIGDAIDEFVDGWNSVECGCE